MQGENDAADQPDPKLKHLPRGAYTIYDERLELMTQSPDIGATLINVQHSHVQLRHITGKLSIRRGHPGMLPTPSRESSN